MAQDSLTTKTPAKEDFRFTSSMTPAMREWVIRNRRLRSPRKSEWQQKRFDEMTNPLLKKQALKDEAYLRSRPYFLWSREGSYTGIPFSEQQIKSIAEEKKKSDEEREKYRGSLLSQYRQNIVESLSKTGRKPIFESETSTKYKAVPQSDEELTPENLSRRYPREYLDWTRETNKAGKTPSQLGQSFLEFFKEKKIA